MDGRDRAADTDTDAADEPTRRSRHAVDRRTLLKIAGAGAVGAAAVPSTAAGSTADGPTVYVPNKSGTLFALDVETGEEIWRFEDVTGGVESSPTVVNGTVYLTSRQQLVAVAADTGEPEWTYEPDVEYLDITASPTVVDGTVYTGDERVRAIDADSGEQQWASNPFDGEIDTAVAVADGTIYAGEREGPIAALDQETGDLQWTFQDDGAKPTSTLTVAGGNVFFGAYNAFYALDGSSGSIDWSFDWQNSHISTPAFSDGTLYASTIYPTYGLFAVDPESGTSEWSHTGGSSTRPETPAAVGDEHVFVGMNDETIRAVDRSTGEARWTFEDPTDDIETSPTVLDGTVYASCDDQTVYAVDAESGELDWAFEDSTSEFGSSPTVVGNPSGGDSIDSRVLHGMYGHHHLGPEDVDVSQRLASSGEATSSALPGPGVAGALAAIGGAGYLLSRRDAAADE